ncbi:MAG: PKD domain-containing protein, partial [Thermoanaerobaculaceae bacterium]|nr:PKD domain-containing protein [Thermoanaerobaculaceae bacterium]
GLYLFDDSACGASGCSLACTPVVPASAVAGAPVAFLGGFLQGGCTGTPTFDWDFGDGSAHSSEQNPSHAYPFGGAFRWSVAVTLAGASCATSGTISVASSLAPISAPGAYAYVVPTSAHKPGYNGTNWVTDLVLTNPGLTDTVARVYFIKGGRDNTGSPARPVIVPLRRSLRLSDVVASTFSESSASGAILVGSDVPLIVTSRTYNDALAGTYGQFVPGIPLGQAVGPATTAWLTGLSQSASDTLGFRTNIGVVNAGAQHVQVQIALYGGDGFFLGSKSVDLNPYDFQQVDKVFAGLAASGVDDGYALVSSATPGAVLFAYASVIDNGTGDPIAVPASVPPTVP